MLQLLYFLTILACSNSAVGLQPNIVFIIADDLGYHDVGYHGANIFTPNIDELAVNGVILENYYVQPICTPSRSQLMTGRYQIHTGLQHSVIFAPQRNCLPLDEITLPQKLKEVGYGTHLVGKWHLGMYRKECLPTYRGFDSHYGYLAGAEDYYSKLVTAKVNGERFAGLDFRDDLTPVFSANGTYSTYLYEKRATEIIYRHDQRKPLFLYMAFQSVHFPLEAPQHYIDMYSHVKDKNRRIYSAMLTAMDDAVGAIVDALKDTKMFENTLVIFTTDNGGQTLFGGNNWPLRGRKASLWEGGVRGVGFVHGAGVKDTKRTSMELMHVSDWFPTLLHVAGANATVTKPLDGLNVWEAITHKTAKSPRTEILHNIDPSFTRPYSPTPPMRPYINKHGVDTLHGHTALRMNKWKLYTGDPGYENWDPVPSLYLNSTVDTTCLVSDGYHPDCITGPEALKEVPSVRLFDILADPEERHDVADYFPHIVDTMLGKIAAYNKTAVPYRFPKFDPRSNPALQGGVWGPWV
ncbi:unnamed protein product [Clavelina lepadiformis]|uniref:Sulfatase N-terminal domain-containing protein n=1 Tax=Clavelina lepadiformis TaxID=159417 RepID=A0ABP0GRV1_CLALP